MLARRALAILVSLSIALTVSGLAAQAQDSPSKSYLVVFAATESVEGVFQLGGDHASALALVQSAGGTVTADLTQQIAVMLARSTNPAFADVLRSSSLVAEVGEDFGWKQFPSTSEAIASGALTVVDAKAASAAGAPDPLEDRQWSMKLIHAPQARAVQPGLRAVSVGILDSGIDASHVDFNGPGGTNVDCVRGRNFIPLGPAPQLGTPSPCTDNQFHGTHVSGIVAAQANNLGVVGVAPGVTLVPVKVCDSQGFCYVGPVVAGITYAGDARLDVINMSFFMDDAEFQASTEFKCDSDPRQRAFKESANRALRYARQRGVTPVAALGNSDTDLQKQPCDVVPAESPGVVGVMAVGPASQKASYSSYGYGPTDVAAPGGAGTTMNCSNTVLSTIPGGYGCFQGTSMASPHAAGVAALIASQLGDGASPSAVQTRLQATAIDIGLAGYDKCFGNGRIDALRAVQNQRSAAYDASAPFCPEYSE